MSEIDAGRLETTVHSLHERFPGPGGMVGVVKDGETLLTHAWGYADPHNHVLMSTNLLFPICSVTKQFTCALLLDLLSDPSQLDGSIANVMPALSGERPTVVQLCNNQSGIRDYWALTVLLGAQAEGRFTDADASQIMARTRTTHFKPGSQYSYSNSNFAILSQLLEHHTSRSFPDLLQTSIFDRVSMTTATVASDTSQSLNGIVGHEGSSDLGFFPAVNRIVWSGDAAIAATLNDMLAWERFIDRTRDNPDALYSRLSALQRFSDGTPARYGYGIARETIDGLSVTGHGGALRGFRCRRLHVAERRLSVVVMFNHQADAHAAATCIARAALGHKQPPEVASFPGAKWEGHFIEPISGLALDVRTRDHQLNARFGISPETMVHTSNSKVQSREMTLSLERDHMRIERVGENFLAQAKRISGPVRPDIEGLFYSEELDSWLSIVSAGGVFHASFKGFLGESMMYPLTPLGGDIWLLLCRRSMDAPSPGYWTMQVRRDIYGKISGLTIGCWLARSIEFAKRT